MTVVKRYIPTILLFIVLLSACSGSDQEQTAAKGDTSVKEKVLKLSAPGEIPGIDPILADNDFSFNIINQVFEGLYRLDKQSDPQLALAAEEPDIIENGRV